MSMIGCGIIFGKDEVRNTAMTCVLHDFVPNVRYCEVFINCFSFRIIIPMNGWWRMTLERTDK